MSPMNCVQETTAKGAGSYRNTVKQLELNKGLVNVNNFPSPMSVYHSPTLDHWGLSVSGNF